MRVLKVKREYFRLFSVPLTSAKDPVNFDADPEPGSALEKMDPDPNPDPGHLHSFEIY